ncbi:MAG: hypothetical protein G3M78_02380 [Candidatus Nitrohelix vancouverensis]|uniref:Uncharacterized protein n=1 Tax=Candidatus Nitrohelix vancouverensis TaxID=2705534 RepID=A0A7T0C0I6_9BACT|nr:MAG: hypothetical protein G3M78_02380 [Candidatus Nitrohelix vancouverensis]
MSLKKMSLKKKFVAFGLAMAVSFFALQSFDSKSNAQGFDADLLGALDVMGEIMGEISAEISAEIAQEVEEQTEAIVLEDIIQPGFANGTATASGDAS